MGSEPILKCPLAKESGFTINIVSAYFLTNGYPALIREVSLCVKVPEPLSTEVRRIHQCGVEKGWVPLIRMTRMIKHCSRCIPGVSWGRGDPCFYLVPTDISPKEASSFAITYTQPPRYIDP